MAGLFFCLTSAEGAGLLFCPTAIQPRTSVYSAFCAVNANYTTNATKQRTWLYRRFSCGLANSTDADTRPTKADMPPPAPRWSVSQRRNTSSTYQIPTPPRALYSSAQPPIIIMYMRAQHTANHASPAGSRCFPRPAAGGLAPGQPGGSVQQQGVAGGAEPLTAIAVSLFGLSPDANSRSVPAGIVVTASGIVVANSRSFYRQIVVE